MSNYLDKGWFYLVKRKKEKDSIEDILSKYDIDLNNYWILKYTDRFRFIDIDELYDYAGFICFRKDIFNKEHIDMWIEFIYNDLGLKGPMTYLVKPLPAKEIMSKINLIEWDMN